MTGLLRTWLIYLGAKGGDREMLERFCSDPESVRLTRIPPPSREELAQQACKNDQVFCKALMVLAGEGRIRRIPRDEFEKKYDFMKK